MGFNISGLVINDNYKNKLSELEAILGEKLVFDKEVTFEEASENWKADVFCDVYFSDLGTLVFLSMERSGFQYYPRNKNVFSFVLSEMMMMFSINFIENGANIRSFLETESEIIDNKGEPFDFELQQEDKSELIYHLIEETLGESFHEVALETTCFRYAYKKVEEEKNEVPMSNEQETRLGNEKGSHSAGKPSKPWWKFW